ncbi:hypothetical protein J2S09_002104 [Bacillus fengqiuensis]|nr:hypothetical protein [Bacillus fengqiuensis]
MNANTGQKVCTEASSFYFGISLLKKNRHGKSSNLRFSWRFFLVYLFSKKWFTNMLFMDIITNVISK